jgi:ATP-dependent Lon protease
VIDSHCEKEKGVRNLRRALFTISRKANLHSLLGSDTKTFTKSISSSSDDGSIVISKEMVEEYLKSEVPRTQTIHGYI